ncbi:efflux RND transporter periplasmic adaptor subunit [Kitasatospora sp. KL5]|uniref:efflux RND transporter periplasmic adaptor subunit n=1 Tax=Kitasatospora sp. KL5 TaxID=3425125 RepID=UPI003D6DFF8D
MAEAQRRKDQAQRAVAASTITAPAAGFVESVNTAVGADPSCEEPVVVLRADELQVESSIDAATLAKLRVGQQALVTVPDARARGMTALEGLPTSAVTPGSRDQPVSGEAGSDVLGAYSREGEGDRTAGLGGQAARYLMELRLPVPPAGVLPGIRAEVTLTLDSRDHVLAVPPSAIHHDREGDYVLVLQCDDIEESGECRKSVPVRTTVRLGLAGDRLTEVISGLAENDSVILPAPEK